jgi:hypothetical protein
MMAGKVDRQGEPQMLPPFPLEKKSRCYVNVANVEGLLQMMVFQDLSQPGEESVCVAGLLFTREQFQEMMRMMGTPEL